MYPPKYTKGARSDLTVETPDRSATLAWIEVELGKNADQIKDYCERYSEPVKSVWGKRIDGGDLSLEEIRDYLGKHTGNLPPQTKINVRHLMQLIKDGLGRCDGSKNLNLNEFLESFENFEIQTAASRLLDVANEAGAHIWQIGSGVRIRAKCQLVEGGNVIVAWIYPPNRPGLSNLKGLKDFSFGARISTLHDCSHPELQATLEQWIEKWSNNKELTTEYVSNKEYRAYSINPNDAVKHIDTLACHLKDIISKVGKL